MRLLNVAKMISANSPGAALIARMLPRKSIDGLTLAVARGLLFGDPEEEEVHERDEREHDRDRESPAHAEEADREAAEHAGDDEGDALHGADQAVGVRVPLDGDEQRDGRRQGDVAHVLDDRPEQDDAGEEPEPRAADVEQRRLGLREVQRARDEERRPA